MQNCVQNVSFSCFQCQKWEKVQICRSSEFDRGQIVGLRETELAFREIVARVNINPQNVLYCANGHDFYGIKAINNQWFAELVIRLPCRLSSDRKLVLPFTHVHPRNPLQ